MSPCSSPHQSHLPGLWWYQIPDDAGQCVITDQDPTMFPGGITNYSHHTVRDYPWVSSSFLPCTHSLLFPFLFNFPTTYLLLLVEPSFSECLESSQEWSLEYMSHLCIMPLSRGHLEHGLPPQACPVHDWWSSQISSLSMLHGTGLVVITVSLLAHLPDWPHMKVIYLQRPPIQARLPT